LTHQPLLFFLPSAAPSCSLWNQYWKAALDTERNSPGAVKGARERYEKYMSVLDEAIKAEEANKEGGNRRTFRSESSPLVGWRRRQDGESSSR